jgi:hypothetical protein
MIAVMEIDMQELPGYPHLRKTLEIYISRREYFSYSLTRETEN